ncbi:MAG: ABC transporter permease [Synergistaceae bacterium]|jgi:peptide/nickel transport system permease protein|nr:ABC transporter permease [Synergistaceae bacterium]
MWVYLLRRLLQMVVVLMAVSLIVFCVMSFTGDPVLMIVPPNASDLEVEEARRALGLDRPLWVQYLVFVRNLARGDMGRSYIFKQPVSRLVTERMPATFEMVGCAVLFALLVAVPSGVYAAAKPNSLLSRMIMGGSLVGISLPSFWVGILLIFFFAVELRLLPSSGRGRTQLLFGIPWSFLTWDGLRHLILPSITLALGTLAVLLRLIRAQMREVLRQDFVRFARAKGVSSRQLLFSHALKNALIPVVTFFGLQVGNLIAFATVTETIFAWPGMGKLLVDSINASDRPVIVAYLMIVSAIFVGINFAIDVVYTLIDPRIDLQ